MHPVFLSLTHLSRYFPCVLPSFILQQSFFIITCSLSHSPITLYQWMLQQGLIAALVSQSPQITGKQLGLESLHEYR